MKSVTTLLLAMLFVMLQPGLAQAREYQEGKNCSGMAVRIAMSWSRRCRHG